MKNKNDVIISNDDEYNSFCDSIYLMSQVEVMDKIKEGEGESIKNMEKYSPKKSW